MRTTVSIGFVLLLVGCSEDRVQSVVNSSSPDRKYLAVVRYVFAENTTGSTPQLFILPAGQTFKGDSGHVVDGSLNGTFTVYWASSNSLLVEYKEGEWASELPAATNFGGITIAFRPAQGGP